MANKIIKAITKSVIKYLTISEGKSKIPKTREVTTPANREMKKPATDSLKCPYCFSTKFTRRGWRQKKHEKVQLYLCQECKKTFTAQITKGKHYPLAVIFDAVSLYNLGYSLEKTCEIVNRSAAEIARPSGKQEPGTKMEQDVKDKRNAGTGTISIGAAALSTWLSEFSDLCRFARMREFAIKKYSPADMVVTATLAHQQLFRYRYHQAKCELMIQEDFKHRKFTPLKEFLEMVPLECPHQFFQKGLRASETPLAFSKKQMIVRAKQNYATRLCQLVLQSVKERRQRHNALQKFMLYNDSVTVATEVPVYLTKDDLLHLQTQLGFEIYNKPVPADIDTEIEKTGNSSQKKRLPKLQPRQGTERQKTGATSAPVQLPRLITGHIDILQIRNGQIHIMDYKPKAEKVRPIEQLTLYAMALSRLTGLRLFELKCAWFDENDYFEFYPLHVLHKPKRGSRRRKIETKEGTYLVNKIKKKVERIRPV